LTKKITGLEELELDQQLSEEAKSIVVLAFRNGPIEDVHAGKECPTCSANSAYSHITQEEMKRIMKRAVDKVYALLWIRDHHPDVFRHVVNAGNAFTTGWDSLSVGEKQLSSWCVQRSFFQAAEGQIRRK
jgi:hypothetical protein